MMCRPRRAAASTGSGTGIVSMRPLRVGVRRLLVDLLGGADLDELAEVHDADAVGEVLEHGEVVRDDDVGQPVSSAGGAFIMLRICDWIDTSRAETGSSATIEPRVQRQRTGEADPLALAAGELVRVEVDRLLASPTSRSSSPTRSHCSVRDPMLWTLSGSRRIVPTRMRGSSEAYGSWNMIWKSRRPRRRSLRPSLVTSSPVETDRARRRLLERHDEPADRRLAAARLPDEAEGLALAHRERDVRDGLDAPDLALQDRSGGDRELLHEPVDLEDHLAVLEVLHPLQGRGLRRLLDRRRREASGGAPTSLPTGLKQATSWPALRRRAAAPRPGTARSRCGSAARTGSRRTHRSGRAGRPGCCRAGCSRPASIFGIESSSASA